MATGRGRIAPTVMLMLLALAGCGNEGGEPYGGAVIGGGSRGVGGGVGVGVGLGGGSGVAVGGGSGGVSMGVGLGSGRSVSSPALDRILAEDAVLRALEHERSGTALRWHNADSGNSGVFTPLNTYRSDDGRDCRDYRHEITIGGRTETIHGAACRKPEGGWQEVMTTR